MNLTTRKSDCHLQVLNSQMVQIAEFEGVIQLFEHEHAGFRFWHGVVDIADVAPVIGAFETGQHEDIKIRMVPPTGETALAKKNFFQLDKNPPFDQAVLGVVGLSEMKTW